MSLYTPVRARAHTRKCWDTGHGVRLQAGLTNSNKAGSRSQNPKAQKIAVGGKNTPMPTEQERGPGIIHGLLLPRKVLKSLLYEETTENACPGYRVLLAISLSPLQPLTTCRVQQDVRWVVGFQAQSRQGCLGQTWRRACCVERRGEDAGGEVASW